MDSIVTEFLGEIILITTLFSGVALIVFSIFFGFLMGNGYIKNKYRTLKNNISKRHKKIKKNIKRQFGSVKRVCKKYYNSLIKPAFIGGVAAVITVIMLGGLHQGDFFGGILQTKLYNLKNTEINEENNQEDKDTSIELKNDNIASIVDGKIGGVGENGEIDTNYKILVSVNPFEYDEESVKMVNKKLQCKEDNNILQWQEEDSIWNCREPFKTIFGSVADSVDINSSGEMVCDKNGEFLF